MREGNVNVFSRVCHSVCLYNVRMNVSNDIQGHHPHRPDPGSDIFKLVQLAVHRALSPLNMLSVRGGSRISQTVSANPSV